MNTDLQVSNPQVNVEIDRDKANALGVSAFQVENALETAYSSRQISTIYTPNNEYWVMAELLPKYQMDPQALSLLYIRSSSGQLVPLSAVSRFTQSLGPLDGQSHRAVAVRHRVVQFAAAAPRSAMSSIALSRSRGKPCPPTSAPTSKAPRSSSNPPWWA